MSEYLSIFQENRAIFAAYLDNLLVKLSFNSFAIRLNTILQRNITPLLIALINLIKMYAVIEYYVYIILL